MMDGKSSRPENTSRPMLGAGSQTEPHDVAVWGALKFNVGAL